MRPKRTVFRDLRDDPRLVSRFRRRVPEGDPAACWPFEGCRNHSGYGKFGIEGRVHFAHRVAWELAHGPIPDDMRVLHRCDNRPCCNPSHLFLGTMSDNMHDMWSKGRHAPPARIGEGHHSAKLTEDDIRQIRALAASGVFQRVIAEQYGVTQTNVGQIVRRKTWTHVA